jgi:hypothetical protein
VVRERLAARHRHADGDLRWHWERSGELDGILDRAAVDDCTVAADRPLAEVAGDVADLAVVKCE